MTDADLHLDRLLDELPSEHPVPPGLDAAVLTAARIPSPAPEAIPPALWGASRWALVAALLIGGVLGAATWAGLQAPPALVLTGGSQLVQGSARVLAGDRVVDVDGRALITVEPGLDLMRGEGQEADTMNRTHLITALAGSLVTVAVYEGSAVISGGDVEAMTIQSGERVSVGDAPAPGTPKPVKRAPTQGSPDAASIARQGALSPDDAEAAIAALQDEVEALRAQQAMADGQLAAVRGEPIPWPDDLPEAFLPATFERNMRTLIEEEGAGELLELDCNEFPCLTVLKPGPYDGDGTPPEVLALVERMQELLGETGVSMHNSKTMSDQESLYLAGLAFAPKNIDNPEDLQVRSAYRMENHLRGIAEDLMGAPTDEDVDVE